MDYVTYIVVGVAVCFQFMMVFLEDDWNLPFDSVGNRLDALKAKADRFPAIQALLHYGELLSDVALLITLAVAFLSNTRLDPEEITSLTLIAGCEAYSLAIMLYGWFKKNNIWERHYMFFIFCGPSVILMQNLFQPGFYKIKSMTEFFLVLSMISVLLTHAWGPFQTIVFDWNTKAIMRLLIDYIPRGVFALIAIFALFLSGGRGLFGVAICTYLAVSIHWKATADMRNNYLRLNE